jgi:hypothetical protein
LSVLDLAIVGCAMWCDPSWFWCHRCVVHREFSGGFAQRMTPAQHVILRHHTQLLSNAPENARSFKRCLFAIFFLGIASPSQRQQMHGRKIGCS